MFKIENKKNFEKICKKLKWVRKTLKIILIYQTKPRKS